MKTYSFKIQNPGPLKLLGVLVIVVAAYALIAVIIIAAAGVAIGAANAWVLQGPFSEGWSSAWNRPLQTLGWSLLVLLGIRKLKKRGISFVQSFARRHAEGTAGK